MLAYCGGESTEPQYFEIARQDLGVASLHIRPCGDGDPLAVVKKAARFVEMDRAESRKSGSSPYDVVWVIVDVDRFNSVREAQAEAKAAGIHLVVSNPCFEVWLLDHVRPCPDRCSDTRTCQREAIEAGLLESTDRSRKSAEKQKNVRQEAVSGRERDAVENAARHNTPEKRAARTNSPGSCSKYSVWTDMEDVMRRLLEESGKR